MAKKPNISDILKELSERVFKLEDEVKKLRLKQKKFDNKTIGGFAQYVSPKEMGLLDDPEYKIDPDKNAGQKNKNK